MSKDLFPTIIGQESIKSRLKFLLDNFGHSHYLNNILLLGCFGSGKSTIGLEIAKKLFEKKNPTKIKKLIKIHGGSLKEESDFFDLIVIPYLSENQEVTLILEEFHNVSEKVQQILLTVFENDNSNHITTYLYSGSEFSFDFTNISVIACSTDGQDIDKALASRFETIELETCNDNHIINILKRGLGKFSVAEELKEIIPQYVQKNPRAVMRLAGNIKSYLERENKNKLDILEWKQIKKGLQLNLFGLDNYQISILRLLKANPNSSLTKLSAMLSLNPSTVRTYYELPLLKLNLMNIKAGAGRQLGMNGHKYLERINKEEIEENS